MEALEPGPYGHSYASLEPVTRKQILVQLDDDMVTRLDAVALELGISRSGLIRRGLNLYLDRLTEAEDDRRSVESYKRMPEDPAEDEIYARLAAETMIEW